jgi:hypothetical protein
MNDLIDLLEVGSSKLWLFLSTPFVTTVAAVFFGAFIAMRAFYIQKRHERMASAYEQCFERITSVISLIESEERDQAKMKATVDKLSIFIRTSGIYFSREALVILGDFNRESRRPEPNPPSKDADKEWVQLLMDCLDRLIFQAELDLRPNLFQFAKEFCVVFVGG